MLLVHNMLCVPDWSCSLWWSRCTILGAHECTLWDRSNLGMYSAVYVLLLELCALIYCFCLCFLPQPLVWTAQRLCCSFTKWSIPTKYIYSVILLVHGTFVVGKVLSCLLPFLCRNSIASSALALITTMLPFAFLQILLWHKRFKFLFVDVYHVRFQYTYILTHVYCGTD